MKRREPPRSGLDDHRGRAAGGGAAWGAAGGPAAAQASRAGVNWTRLPGRKGRGAPERRFSRDRADVVWRHLLQVPE